MNADCLVSTSDLTGLNMFAYCGNNPVNRADPSGEAWWVVAGVIVGGIVGAVTKAVSNILTGEEWNVGIIGAAVGGAVSGGILAATGNIWAAGFAGAAAESLTNEILSYIPTVSKWNGQAATKKVTTENVINSTKTVLNDTIINGVVSAVTGKFAAKVVPTNNGWFKPKKFFSSFLGKYAIKSNLQTLTQSGIILGVEGFKYSYNKRLSREQQTIVFFSDAKIQAAR